MSYEIIRLNLYLKKEGKSYKIDLIVEKNDRFKSLKLIKTNKLWFKIR